MKHPRNHQNRNHQKSLATSTPGKAFSNIVKSRGDTLIEILITFFVIAVGILGASSMQIVALQNVNGASSRDQAIIIAENVAESIRASNAGNYINVVGNPDLSTPVDNLPSGDITVGMDADNTNSIDLLSPPANLQIAETGDGDITITTNGTTTILNNVTITAVVRWDEDRSGSNGRTCPAVSSADLDCYQITLSP